MRSRGVRLDLFICMIIAGALFAGIWFIGDKTGIIEKTFHALDMLLEGEKNVPDGEVGGYATDDTIRVSTVEELVVLAEEDKTFTIETSSVRYSNYGVYEADDYAWRVVKLDDDNAMVVKLNVDKIQYPDDSHDVILPVGKVVLEAPGALEEISEDLVDSDLTLIVDAYIDMDGEANTTYIDPNMQSVIMVTGIVMMIVPIVLFVLYIVVVFKIHSIFVKKGIFPPVFNKNN